MFSDALTKVLQEGHPNLGSGLSVADVAVLIKRRLRDAYPEDWVRPEVLSPDQAEGDLAELPLFPNPAFPTSTSTVDSAIYRLDTEREVRAFGRAPFQTNRQTERVSEASRVTNIATTQQREEGVRNDTIFEASAEPFTAPARHNADASGQLAESDIQARGRLNEAAVDASDGVGTEHAQETSGTNAASEAGVTTSPRADHVRNENISNGEEAAEDSNIVHSGESLGEWEATPSRSPALGTRIDGGEISEGHRLAAETAERMRLTEQNSERPIRRATWRYVLAFSIVFLFLGVGSEWVSAYLVTYSLGSTWLFYPYAACFGLMAGATYAFALFSRFPLAPQHTFVLGCSWGLGWTERAHSGFDPLAGALGGGFIALLVFVRCRR
jgi:hypothetical protein